MIKRGNIYFVKRRNELTYGSETAKSRPGIIVSNDALNATSDVVEVVYLTTQPKKDLPTHVKIDATGTPSVALCEQIDHVSVQLLGNWSGVCNDEEMAAIDAAMMCSLGIETAPVTVNIDQHALARAIAERDTYKAMLDKIMSNWGIN